MHTTTVAPFYTNTHSDKPLYSSIARTCHTNNTDYSRFEATNNESPFHTATPACAGADAFYLLAEPNHSYMR